MQVRYKIYYSFFKLLLLTGFSAPLFLSCNSVYTPRPKGYFKIDFPQHKYQLFDKPGYPYTFEYPVYANVLQDSSFFEEQPENLYWINIDFPQFSGKIYLSYIEIGGKRRYKIPGPGGKYNDSVGVNNFNSLIKDSYNLLYKHAPKASSIEDSAFTNVNQIEGIYFKIGGNAATAHQFLATDSIRHFLRGALYFDATPNEDSLSIVNDFLKQDMKHMINTLKWQ